MRCLSCDIELTDLEATRRSAVTGDYLDLCGGCFYFVLDSLDNQEWLSDESLSDETGPIISAEDIAPDRGHGPDEDEV